MKWGIPSAWLLLAGAADPAIATLPDGYGTLYLSPHASVEVYRSAADLADLLERSFGERPAVRREVLGGFFHGLHIGSEPHNPAFDDNPLTDEILIERSGRGIEILGSDNSAACFAIYRFAEECLGWRYYHPGELGLERLDTPPAVPATKGEREILLLEKAGFYSRNPYPSIGGTTKALDWAKWHGVRERFVYNHTLHAVVTPDQFDAHPDWFAKDEKGQPMRPPFAGANGYNNHPDLANPQVREWVAGRTIQALEKARVAAGANWRETGYPPVRFSPGMVSTSLSLGDSFVFGHFDKDYPWIPDEYFRRWPDWSNHVFDYTNAVAQEVVSAWKSKPWPCGERPELYLGALSYLNWEDVPDFDVHPSIVPYMTFDRSQWFNPEAKADDLALVEKWAAKETKILGTWDYLFGYGFLMPRSMVGIVSDSIPALYERGVRAYFCQVASLWPYDAHTTWLATRLLWNPQADAGQLMEEFYREYFGPAAVPMREFFGLAESAWMSQPGRGWWLKYWKDPWQAALWEPGVLDSMQDALDTALAQTTGSERFNERVQAIRELFTATRLFVTYETAAWTLNDSTRDATDAAAIAEALELAEQALEARAALVTQVRRTVGENPLAARAGDLEWILRYDNVGGCLGTLGRQAVLLRDESLLGSTRQLLDRWNQLEGRMESPSFEYGRSVLFDKRFAQADDSRIWHRHFLDSDGLAMARVEDRGGFRTKASRRGQIFQLFLATPGHFYLGQLDLETDLADSGEIYLRLDFLDQNHSLIGESRYARIAPVQSHGNYQRLHVLMQAPMGTAFGRAYIRFYEMDPETEAILNFVDVLDLGGPLSP